MKPISVTTNKLIKLIQKSLEEGSAGFYKEGKKAEKTFTLIGLFSSFICLALMPFLPDEILFLFLGFLVLFFASISYFLKGKKQQKKYKQIKNKYDSVTAQYEPFDKILFEISSTSIKLEVKGKENKNISFQFNELAVFQWLGSGLYLENTNGNKLIVPLKLFSTVIYNQLHADIKKQL